MNTDILKGKWTQLKGDVKKQWGKLTDDDLMQAEGNTDKLIGLLQQKYGYTRDKAQEEIQSFMDRYK